MFVSNCEQRFGMFTCRGACVRPEFRRQNIKIPTTNLCVVVARTREHPWQVSVAIRAGHEVDALIGIDKLSLEVLCV
jgi:hypothetical protein